MSRDIRIKTNPRVHQPMMKNQEMVEYGVASVGRKDKRISKGYDPQTHGEIENRLGIELSRE
jgi:hypothetical protein